MKLNYLKYLGLVILCLSAEFLMGQNLKSEDVGKNYSQLWGKAGELWDHSKIPDFTKAGYMEGKDIPHYPMQVSVTDFGAIGDGVTDNTLAFKKAISNCQSHVSIYIPAGKYLLKDTINIAKSGICLVGAGPDSTFIYFDHGLEELYPNYNVDFKNQTSWSWSGAMILFSENSSNSGIENLCITFPDSLWQGHHFHERGYNGIGFANSAHDDWLRDIVIKGADLGIWIASGASHITAENWILDFGAFRKAEKINGHHGVNIYGAYNLLQDFQIRGKFQHDLSVEGEHSIYNVFSHGEGEDVCIDHHNHAQSHNLFTEIDAGLGNRLYASGGVETPRGICSNEVFWNITATNNMVYCNQYDTMEKHSKNNVQIGIKTNLPSVFNDVYGNWFETIEPSSLFPKNLYKAQMEYKTTQ